MSQEAKRIFSVSEVSKSSEEKATKTVFYTSNHTTGAVWVVKPGQEVVAHIHSTADDIWVCLKGKAKFYLEQGKEVEVTEGDVILSAPEQCHGGYNHGEEDFIFISFIGPVPTDFVPLANE